jgi:hypothetical protein
VDDIAYLYLELMDRMDLRDLDVIGCSIGGWIAAEIATKSPERIRRLVLVSPIAIKVGPADKLDIPDIFAMPEEDVQKLLYHDPSRMKRDVAKMTNGEITAMFRARETLALLTWEPWMHNPKLKRRLHRVAASTLFLRGESDGVVSQAYLEAYSGLLPQSRRACAAGRAARGLRRLRAQVSRRLTCARGTSAKTPIPTCRRRRMVSPFLSGRRRDRICRPRPLRCSTRVKRWRSEVSGTRCLGLGCR